MNPTAFKFGLRSSPELADHGFQGLTVLPGAWLIAAGLAEARADRWSVRHARFEQPVLVTAEDQEVAMRWTERPDRPLGCEFVVGGTTAARFELDLEAEPAAIAGNVCRIPMPLAGAEIYAALDANGNRYGPAFRCLERIGIDDRRATAGIRTAVRREPFRIDPLAIDAAVQLLAALCAGRGRTFVLTGIGAMKPGSAIRSLPVIGAAELTGDDRGEVTLFDAAGECVLQLKEVTFALLDRLAAPVPVVISATFTAEPIEDSLMFWSERARLPVAPRFAPYNQVFQELLDPAGASRANGEGINVFLLNLADWLAPSTLPGCPDCKPEWPADLERHRLANGLEVAHLNRHETEYVYQEIFADRCYMRHGIEIPEAAVVVDIGANIGLFSLFVRTERPDATVYAYEPSPVAFRALSANCRTYGPGLHPFNAGVSGGSGEAPLTFYRRSSVFSSFHPDNHEDRSAIETVAANVLRRELGATDEPVDDLVRDLTADRLEAETFLCPLVGVSDLIREHGLARIDLLKIDAEKCELEILRGIAAEHWARISQVVVEVHDRTGAMLEAVQSLLADRGFHCSCEEERLLAGSGLFNVYAVRRRAKRALPGEETPADQRWHELQAKAAEMERALSAYALAGGPPAIVVFAPAASGSLSAQDVWRVAAIESRLAVHARELVPFHVVESAALRSRHPRAAWHAAGVETSGHQPFTPDGYALLGTAVVRAVAALRRRPFKAIALDCDQTLWKGVCGEDGTLGVEVTPAHRLLQEFLLRQMQAGMMLCLCSKNEEVDVWAVFEGNPGMVLRREHFAAAQIGWAPKSEGLRRLAQTLNIGLEALLCLDDNPVEIAEMRAACPNATPLLAEVEAAQRSWEHYWPFDLARSTADDRARTRRMHEAAQRERFREGAGSLGEFIAALRLEVAFASPSEADLGRLSQLTLRTNQFNFTTVRRSEFDLRRFLAEPGTGARSVEVRDRFGDYGCVGLVLYRCEGDLCRVDTFLLSCRVLGRGVEHRVAAEIGRLAEQSGATVVEWRLRPSARNRPAADFAETLPAVSRRLEVGATVHTCNAAALTQLRYRPDTPASAKPALPEAQPEPASPYSHSLPPEEWEAIARLEADQDELRAAIERHRLLRAGVNPDALDADAPGTLPGRMLSLWRRILANPALGPDQNFLEAGGSSLKAVQLVAAIRRELGVTVTVTQFFESPTVRALSATLAAGRSLPSGPSDAQQRGARRKLRLRRSAA